MTLLRRFFGSDEGGATVELVLWLPLWFAFFLSTFEIGYLSARQVMLDRALDITVREIRLGQISPVNHANILSRLCDNVMLLPNCASDVKLEMRTIDPRAWTAIPAGADCVDRDDDSVPVRAFVQGAPNQLMFLRVCALYDPMAPTAGIGAVLQRQSGDAYALVSTSSYVVEPH